MIHARDTHPPDTCSCPPRDDLEAFIFGELAPEVQRAVEMHRRTCSQCQKIITFLYRNHDLPFNAPMR